ncbi:DNA gyrase subunit A [Elusimicrobiota bacterium]
MAKQHIPQQDPSRVEPRAIEEEMKSSYIDYAMSVIVGRALPDVRDGLKPVHRRILYAMDEMGLAHNKPFKKAARVVGDVLGKYHPHGDSAIYESMIRMAQDFSLRLPLVQGQGNVGSVDGDPPAAMRYVEARLAKSASELLTDIDKGTVDFVPNYDGTLKEPGLLPAKLPNLLVNGSSGIAVGMATNIPPHNLIEVCDAIEIFIKNPKAELSDLMKAIKGPDLPTGGIIMGMQGIRDYFSTGKGSFIIRAKTEMEDIKGGKTAVIVTEIPYQVNKSTLLETIAGLSRDKKIPDIADLRDESDRHGIRVVIEVKRDGNPHVVLNQLYKFTQLQTSFGVTTLALVDGKPKVLSLPELLGCYVGYRKEVVVRRTKFELAKAEARAHIVEGLRIAAQNINKVIAIIRKSKDTETARKQLQKEFDLSERQAQAILDMRLAQLTALERGKLEDEYKELLATIKRLKEILGSEKKILGIIMTELGDLKKVYGEDRRTKIAPDFKETKIEDLIKREEVVVTISNQGYIKRIPVTTYKAQARGGKGITAAGTKEGEDFIESVMITDTHATILFFTNRGRVYQNKVYEIPESSRVSRGKPVVQFIGIASNKEERVTGVVTMRGAEKSGKEFLILATRKGRIKRCDVNLFENIRKNGITAINLREGDVLVGVLKTNGSSEIILATKNGKSIRFPEDDVRAMGRVAAGVRGLSLGKGDQVIGVEVAVKNEKRSLLTVCEKGYGKRTKLTEYRDQRRGGGGIITIKASERNGPVIGIKLIDDKDDLMMLTEKGMGIRLRAKDIRVISRNTQGLRLVRLEEGDKIACVEPIADDGDPGK